MHTFLAHVRATGLHLIRVGSLAPTYNPGNTWMPWWCSCKGLCWWIFVHPCRTPPTSPPARSVTDRRLDDSTWVHHTAHSSQTKNKIQSRSITQTYVWMVSIIPMLGLDEVETCWSTSSLIQPTWHAWWVAQWMTWHFPWITHVNVTCKQHAFLSLEEKDGIRFPSAPNALSHPFVPALAQGRHYVQRALGCNCAHGDLWYAFPFSPSAFVDRSLLWSPSIWLSDRAAPFQVCLISTDQGPRSSASSPDVDEPRSWHCRRPSLSFFVPPLMRTTATAQPQPSESWLLPWLLGGLRDLCQVSCYQQQLQCRCQGSRTSRASRASHASRASRSLFFGLGTFSVARGSLSSGLLFAHAATGMEAFTVSVFFFLSSMHFSSALEGLPPLSFELPTPCAWFSSSGSSECSELAYPGDVATSSILLLGGFFGSAGNLAFTTLGTAAGADMRGSGGTIRGSDGICLGLIGAGGGLTIPCTFQGESSSPETSSSSSLTYSNCSAAFPFLPLPLLFLDPLAFPFGFCAGGAITTGLDMGGSCESTLHRTISAGCSVPRTMSGDHSSLHRTTDYGIPPQSATHWVSCATTSSHRHLPERTSSGSMEPTSTAAPPCCWAEVGQAWTWAWCATEGYRGSKHISSRHPLDIMWHGPQHGNAHTIQCCKWPIG